MYIYIYNKPEIASEVLGANFTYCCVNILERELMSHVCFLGHLRPAVHSKLPYDDAINRMTHW